MKSIFKLLVLLASFVITATTSHAQLSRKPYADGEVLVKLRQSASLSPAFLQQNGLQDKGRIKTLRMDPGFIAKKHAGRDSAAAFG